MKLIRFKDDTYTWSAVDGEASKVLTKPEAIAYGVWQLKIDRGEVVMGIDSLIAYGNTYRKDNVAVFGSEKKIYLYLTSEDEGGHIK